MKILGIATKSSQNFAVHVDLRESHSASECAPKDSHVPTRVHPGKMATGPPRPIGYNGLNTDPIRRNSHGACKFTTSRQNGHGHVSHTGQKRPRAHRFVGVQKLAPSDSCWGRSGTQQARVGFAPMRSHVPETPGTHRSRPRRVVVIASSELASRDSQRQAPGVSSGLAETQSGVSRERSGSSHVPSACCSATDSGSLSPSSGLAAPADGPGYPRRAQRSSTGMNIDRE